MTQLRSGYWRDLTTKDFATIDTERTVALLPVGAVEQHGPHLPLGTDTAIGEGIVTRCLARPIDGVTLLALPMLPIGDSVEHEAYAGTLSLTTETLIAMWTQVGESVARAGVRKLILFNSHGGQRQAVDVVAHRLRATHRMLVVRATYFAFGAPPGLISAHELAHGVHGGTLETSLMLELAPDTVRQEHARDFVPRSVSMSDEFEWLGVEKPIGFGWASQDLHAEGVAGDARAATQAAGKQLLDHAASCLAKLASETARFSLENLR